MNSSRSRHVLDTSSLLNLVRHLGSDSITYLKGNYILTLTIYEVGNAVWKEASLIKRISMDEARELLSSLEHVYTFMEVTQPRNLHTVLDTAHLLGITFYDASYIIAAHELDASLVTDDKRLIKRIEAGRDVVRMLLGGDIEILTSSDIWGRPE